MAAEISEKQKPVTVSDAPAVERSTTADTFTTAPGGPINSTDFASHAPSKTATTADTAAASNTATTIETAPASTGKPQTQIDTNNVEQSKKCTAPSTAPETGPASAISARSTGLAAALETSGHSISKIDARNLKQEIKNEKQANSLLATEEKGEAKGITDAIAYAKACVKDVSKQAKYLKAAQKKFDNRTDKEAKAKKALLKAEEAFKEAAARAARAGQEVEVAQKRHTAAVATKEASDIRVEQLRKNKAIHDVAREQRRAEAINKMSDAERALAASGYKKKFGCF